MPGKSELADRIAARGWSKAAASSAVDAVLGEITAALTAGERVTLTGFGTFESAPRGARTARNPRTGDAIEVPATTIARFHPGATLRAQVAAGTPVSLAGLTAGPVGALAPASTVPAPAPRKASAREKASAPEKAPALEKAPARAKGSGKASKKASATADSLTDAELKAAERGIAKAEAAARKAAARKAAAKKADKAKADAKKTSAKSKADAKHKTKHKKK